MIAKFSQSQRNFRNHSQKHGSKYKRLADRPNRENIARRLTDGKVKWGTDQGEKKIINRGDLTEEAKV